MVGKRAPNPFWNCQMVLTDLYNKYPILSEIGSLEMFACVYFPVALLELELQEFVSEEFDTIEHSVLELFYAGFRNAAGISKVMGLPPGYVKKILYILESYGHILHGQVTELGLKSIADGAKYTKNTTLQKVQADTLTGILFTREMYQPSYMLFPAEETAGWITHALPNAFINSTAFEVLRNDIKQYKYYKNSIFHVNVASINYIPVSKEIKYTYGFLVKISTMKHPFIILRCQEYDQALRKTRYYWKPIAISYTSASVFPQVPSEIHIVNDSYFEPLLFLMEDLNRRIEVITSRREKLPEGFYKALLNDFGLNPDQISYSFNKTVLTILIKDEPANKYSGELQQWINCSINESASPIPYVGFAKNDLLPGAVCYFRRGGK